MSSLIWCNRALARSETGPARSSRYSAIMHHLTGPPLIRAATKADKMFTQEVQEGVTLHAFSGHRDLFGTVINEGANKGILVTTATYGSDAYEFAKDKPLTLLSGGELLSLLAAHGHRAKIDLQEAKALYQAKQEWPIESELLSKPRLRPGAGQVPLLAPKQKDGS
jgi:hypothetical protein